MQRLTLVLIASLAIVWSAAIDAESSVTHTCTLADSRGCALNEDFLERWRLDIDAKCRAAHDAGPGHSRADAGDDDGGLADDDAGPDDAGAALDDAADHGAWATYFRGLLDGHESLTRPKGDSPCADVTEGQVASAARVTALWRAHVTSPPIDARCDLTASTPVGTSIEAYADRLRAIAELSPGGRLQANAAKGAAGALEKHERANETKILTRVTTCITLQQRALSLTPECKETGTNAACWLARQISQAVKKHVVDPLKVLDPLLDGPIPAEIAALEGVALDNDAAIERDRILREYRDAPRDAVKVSTLRSDASNLWARACKKGSSDCRSGQFSPGRVFKRSGVPRYDAAGRDITRRGYYWLAPSLELGVLAGVGVVVGPGKSLSEQTGSGNLVDRFEGGAAEEAFRDSLQGLVATPRPRWAFPLQPTLALELRWFGYQTDLGAIDVGNGISVSPADVGIGAEAAYNLFIGATPYAGISSALAASLPLTLTFGVRARGPYGLSVHTGVAALAYPFTLEVGVAPYVRMGFAFDGI